MSTQSFSLAIYTLYMLFLRGTHFFQGTQLPWCSVEPAQNQDWIIFTVIKESGTWEYWLSTDRRYIDIMAPVEKERKETGTHMLNFSYKFLTFLFLSLRCVNSFKIGSWKKCELSAAGFLIAPKSYFADLLSSWSETNRYELLLCLEDERGCGRKEEKREQKEEQTEYESGMLSQNNPRQSQAQVEEQEAQKKGVSEMQRILVMGKKLFLYVGYVSIPWSLRYSI